MLLVSGLMLLVACLIDALGDKPVNRLYLAIGAAFVILSTGVLIFKRK